ncbi:MAG: thiazole biosynthesis adenylyltransferase ThiF [Planctomycetales bacterium]|nr:thiazole biosynthesis adenylyltransferase ThiF [Planctomycetales bacterium]
MPPDPNTPSDFQRYVRQMRYAPIGQEGQARLATGRALVCGCGALGSVLANTLVRAGVGFVRIVDRDFLELNNLQRQVLYDEQDVAAGLPKAVAAAQKLGRINSQVTVEPVVTDFDYMNAESLCAGIDVVADGTDNFETRYLINDVSAGQNLPWVYGGCIGAEGQTMTIVPGQTACLRCLMVEPPPPGSTPTCDTAGIVGSIANVVASIQALEVIKLLLGQRDRISRCLTVIDLWENQLRQIQLDTLGPSDDCPTCGRREFPWLEGRRGSHTSVLCGRQAVQLHPPDRRALSLEALAAQLEGVGTVAYNQFLLRLEVDDYQLTVFPDGRAIIGGTEDIAQAKTLYARYIGH